ncbi:hypothetical protein [Streptomyces filamentosus]|uniref:hypothetical protein n=1 Tax=Streptomyces filamentosus TaxID=67294 RepID=UPI0033172548
MSAFTQHAVTVVVVAPAAVPAPQIAPVPPATPDPAPAVAPVAGKGSSTRWAVTAVLGLAVTGLVLHQVPDLVPITDSIVGLVALFLARRRR